MNAMTIHNLVHKNWFWLGVASLGAVLGGCAAVAITVITLVITAINCANGNSCVPLVGDTVTTATGWSGASGLIAAIATLADPPASNLVNFDASQASAIIEPKNVTIETNGGQATITLTDEATGATLGSATFPFVINGNEATFSNPASVNNWIHSYSSYQGNVKINTSFDIGTTMPPAGEKGSLTITTEYASSPYASSSLSVSSPSGGGCGKVATHCKQN